MKSKATGCGSISTVFPSIVLLCVSSIIIIMLSLLLLSLFTRKVSTLAISKIIRTNQNIIIITIVAICMSLTASRPTEQLYNDQVFLISFHFRNPIFCFHSFSFRVHFPFIMPISFHQEPRNEIGF